MAHTPGPWKTDVAHNVTAGSRRRTVAVCGGYQSNVNWEKIDDENRANACLIAAAPDLLAACKLVLEKYQAYEFSFEAIDAVRAAIAKATQGATTEAKP